MRVVIIGAGIGGLAAAVALRRIGIPSLVLEQAPAIHEVGAGLSIWPNAVHALTELGVAERVLAVASVVERNTLRTASGRTISVTELTGISEIAGAPCICLHRAVLQKILFDTLPTDSVRTGARCSHIDGTTVILETGERIEADVLIGADGISSVVREALHGAEEPRYAGYTGWRGICADNGLLPEGSPILIACKGSQFGTWPCGDGQFYWFLTKNVPPRTRQTKADALALCRNWASPVPQIIEATPEEAILQNDILDRPPLKWWGRSCVTLLGDAAHATTPNLGQGACQALEDAVVLSHCLSEIRPVEAALREYERLRIPRTTTVVTGSWQTGKLLQLDSPILEWLRDAFMGSRLGARMGLRMMENLVTYRVPHLAPATPSPMPANSAP